MSWTKCDCHAQTYTGRASTAYVGVLVNGDRESRKRKLCPVGLSDLLGVAERTLTSSDDYDGDETALFQTCGWCGEPRGENGGAAVFVTLYKLGKIRADYAGCACDEHVADARQNLF